ncbi:MAG: helix-turn-helix domain-containing protein [Eubacterium sp.]|nr:helix-turn-helix domain-containing protein [Eubacterium sp.]
MTNEVFGSRIKELSMEKLARDMGVSRSRVSLWTNTGSVPRMNVLMDLAKYFNVTTDYLLGTDLDTERDSLVKTEDSRLESLQKCLGKLSDEDLEMAEDMLRNMFEGRFTEEDTESAS